MGKQTTVVMLAFVALHVGLILQVVSVATSYWVEGTLEANHTTGTGNETHNDTTTRKGLWVVCVDDDCSKLNKTIQPDWFPATQALAVVGGAGTLAASVLYYVFLIITRFRTSARFHGIVTFVQLIATCCFIIAIAIFGSKALDDTNDFGDDYTYELGWSYCVGIGGTVAVIIALLASMRENCYLRNERSAYENI